MPKMLFLALLMIGCCVPSWATPAPKTYSSRSTTVDPERPGLTVSTVIVDDERRLVTVLAVRVGSDRQNGLPTNPELLVLHGTGTSSSDTIVLSGGADQGSMTFHLDGDVLHTTLNLGGASNVSILSLSR